MPQTNKQDALLLKVKEYIQNNNLILPASRVIAAVSGGADSLALLLMLKMLSEELNFSLSCLHVHHGLRGLDADKDCDFVRRWCEQLSVGITIRRVDVRRYAGSQKIGIELAARRLRHEAYRELLAEHSGKKTVVALAHHLDDQAETLLLNLGRGSGLDGLCAMQAREGFLIRPLLFVRRLQIEEWLLSREITWRNDQTNLEGFTMRNRLRHSLLPVWQNLLGYDPVPALGRAAANLSSDQRLINQLTAEAVASCQIGSQLVRSCLLELPAALQRHVFRQFWADQSGNQQDLEQKHVLIALEWLARAKKWQSLDLPDQKQLIFDGENLTIRNQPADLPDYKNILVPLNSVGNTVVAQLDLVFEAAWLESEPEEGEGCPSVILPADLIEGAVLRTRRPGDLIRTDERQGAVSLNKLLAARQIEPAQRDKIILLAVDSKVIWIPDIATHNWYDQNSARCARHRCIRLTLVKGSKK